MPRRVLAHAAGMVKTIRSPLKLELLERSDLSRWRQILPERRPGHLGDIQIASRVDGAAMRRDELAGLFAGELAAHAAEEIALPGHDAHPRAEVRHVLVDGELRGELAHVELPPVTPIGEEPARPMKIVELALVPSP